jgi:hypothetical protein
MSNVVADGKKMLVSGIVSNSYIAHRSGSLHVCRRRTARRDLDAVHPGDTLQPNSAEEGVSKDGEYLPEVEE